MLVGDVPCSTLTWFSHSLVQCRLTEGQGSNLIVRLVAGGQSAVAAARYSFDAPSITGVSASFAEASNGSASTRAPTAGMAGVFNITGNNFGLDKATPAAVVTFGGFGGPYTFLGANVVVISHTLIQCDIPAGYGTNLEVRVTVGGQNSTAATYTLSYQAPSISSLDYAPSSPAGGGRLTINGFNFGATNTSFSGVATAFVSATACTQTIWVAHNQLVCIVPPLNGQGQNLPVTVTVGGQTSAVTPAASFSYANPFITSIAYDASAPTSGSTLLTLNGLQLGSLTFPPVIRIGNIC